MSSTPDTPGLPDQEPVGETTHVTDPGAGSSSTDEAPRRRRAPWLVAAAALWIFALVLPVTLGNDALKERLTGATGPQDPVVEMSMTADPTVRWTGVGRGVVHLEYQLLLSGADSTTAQVSSGSATTKNQTVKGTPRSVTLTRGKAYRGTADIPVQCTSRVKAGVAATGPIVKQAEIFTWVTPKKDSEGNIACSII